MAQTNLLDFTNTERKLKEARHNSNTSSSSSSSSSSRDLISELPDPLIHHILSFLDMTYVIQTSRLSRRWRYLWPSLTILNFSEFEFDKCKEEMNVLHFYFENFVDKVLLLRDGSIIHTFNLYSRYTDSSNFCKWISVAFWRNVQELDLNLNYDEVPNYLFTCKSLRTLKLGMTKGDTYWDIPDSVCLPALKSLDIRSICFSGGECINKFISSCPVLETLIISECILTDPEILSISAFQLNKLVIKDLFHCDPPSHNCKIIVCTPNLTSFTCKDYMLKDFSLLNFSSRVNAIIDVELEAFYESEADYWLSSSSREQHIQNLIKCLRELCSVRSLTVGVWLLEAVLEGPVSLTVKISPFYNLTFLKLSTSLSRYRIHTVTGFLGNCPNLETLVLKMTKSPLWEKADKLRASSGEEVQYWKTEQPLQCMEYHLKFVEIQDAIGSLNELEFLKFLLKSAMVLENITIFTSKEQSSDDNSRLKSLREELLTFPKASSSIKISFL